MESPSSSFMIAITKDISCCAHFIIICSQIYNDFCHPSSESKLACWDDEFCTKVQTDTLFERSDWCSQDDEPVKMRCKAQPPGSGGKSVIGEEFIFMDLKDTICQAVEGAKEAAAAPWIVPATNKASMTIVLYNGELAVYTVVIFEFDFTARGGKFVTHNQILTAEVPMRTATWTILEGSVAIALVAVMLGELGELADSIKECTCVSQGGYFRDPASP